MNDEVERARDLLADRAHRQVEARHQHHRLDARERVALAVGVDGRQRAVVAGVHRLQHVERLGAAALADDDPVGPHAQRVAEEVADADLAGALDVGRPRLEAHDVRLVEQQLGRVLDRHDALALRQERGEHVEERRLAGAGAAADHAVEARLNRRAQKVHHGRAARRRSRSGRPRVRRCLPKRRIVSVVPSIATGSMIALTREPSRKRASTIGEDSSMRRPSGVMMRSMIRRSWRAFVKRLVGALDHAVALDVDRVRPVDHDFGDVRILHEVFERSEAERFVDDLLAQRRRALPPSPSNLRAESSAVMLSTFARSSASFAASVCATLAETRSSCRSSA